jgi:RNA polymerase sigma-70 factor (ECF subfamily)
LLKAFLQPHAHSGSEVYGWIVRIVRDPSAAEDLTVETFWRIYRARSRFDPRRDFGPWARCSPPDPAVSAELRQKVAAAFTRLPVKLRAAATLAMIEETPYGDIADALGISIGTVKSRVFRAVRLLRGDLQRMGVEP